MTVALPVQAFQIGQRVRHIAGKYFTIGVIYIEYDLTIRYARTSGTPGFTAASLTLAPERPPYVPSERGVVSRSTTKGIFPEFYRRETDAELAARHVVERAAYDAQGDEA